MAIDAERIRFLYRNDQGRIDAVTWLRGLRALALVLAPFMLIWLALSPYTEHNLDNSPLFVPMTAVAYTFVILYSFVVLLVAVSCAFRGAARRRRALAAAARDGSDGARLGVGRRCDFNRCRALDLV